MRTRSRITAMAGISLALTVALPSVASASPVAEPALMAVPLHHERNVVSKSIIDHRYADKNHPIASCEFEAPGGRCSVSSPKDVQRTVQVALGISRESVTHQLGISSDRSATFDGVGSACTFSKDKSGLMTIAPLGVRYKYRIQDKATVLGTHGLSTRTTTSGWLNAFDPDTTSFGCA